MSCSSTGVFAELPPEGENTGGQRGTYTFFGPQW